MGKQTDTTFKHIAILTHPLIKEAASEAVKMAAYLQDRQVHTVSGLLNDEELRAQVKAREFDLVIAVGGDGTVLRAGHLCAPYDVPILPVNMGSLGFLIEVSPKNWREVLGNLLSGNFWFENRMMLHATITHQGEEVAHWDVLNDCVIARGSHLRPVHFRVTLDGHAVTTYVADALVASTPTGSTAYALAAGGPILPPGLRNILIVPVAPHLSIDRAIVLAEGSTVSVRVLSDHDAVVSGDGQTPLALDKDDEITVRASDYTTRLVRFQELGYFYKNLVLLMDQNPSVGDGE
ncbi:MAG TPA: NAD(+)/NADH kinase [Anaerolineales bacterium]|nr:NAD(+)/NADH kinase [Anaerolineales bacterium]